MQWQHGAAGAAAHGAPKKYSTSEQTPLLLQPPGRCASPVMTAALQSANTADEDALQFRHGLRRAGWLWKRFGHGHTTSWKRLWVSLHNLPPSAPCIQA